MLVDFVSQPLDFLNNVGDILLKKTENIICLIISGK